VTDRVMSLYIYWVMSLYTPRETSGAGDLEKPNVELRVKHKVVAEEFAALLAVREHILRAARFQ